MDGEQTPSVNQGFWGFLGRWFWLMALGIVLGGIIAVGYSAGQRFLGGGEKYESVAVVQVQYTLAANGGDVITSGGSLNNLRIIMVERMVGPTFLETVAKELPPEWGLDAEGLLELVLVVPGSGNEPPASVKITAKAADPEIAQKIADTMADVIVRLVTEETQAEMNRILANTSQELDNISASMKKAEEESQAALSEALAADPGVSQLIDVGRGIEGEPLVIGPGLEGDPQRLVQLQTLLIPYSVAQTKLTAIRGAYASQSGALFSARVTKAKLLDPLIVLQEASVALPTDSGLRIRDTLILGGGGGVMMAWIAANFVDNFTGWRRPKRPQEDADTPPPAPSGSTAAAAPINLRPLEERLALAESRMEQLPDLVATEARRGVSISLESSLEKISDKVARAAGMEAMEVLRTERDNLIETARKSARVESEKALQQRLDALTVRAADVAKGKVVQALEGRLMDLSSAAADSAKTEAIQKLDKRLEKLTNATVDGARKQVMRELDERFRQVNATAVAAARAEAMRSFGEIVGNLDKRLRDLQK